MNDRSAFKRMKETVKVSEIDPTVSSFITPELFVTIDILRGDLTRAEFCRKALTEYCIAMSELKRQR